MGKKYFKTLASSVLSKFEDGNEYHFHDVDRSWIIDAMLVFAEIYANEREGKESPDESGNCIKPDVSSSLPPDVAEKILKARDAFVEKYYGEVWHWLYSIASPNYDKTEPWKDLERIAGRL